MHEQKIILPGFVITALVASLAVTGIVPWTVLAGILILAVGLSFTGYLLYFVKQKEQNSDMAKLLKFTEILIEEKSLTQIYQRLIDFAKYISKADNLNFYRLKFGQDDFISAYSSDNEFEEEELIKIQDYIIRYKKTLHYKQSDPKLAREITFSKIKNLMAIPLMKNDELEGFFFFYDYKENKNFTKRTQEMMEYLIKQAEKRITQTESIQKREAILLNIIDGLQIAIENTTSTFAGHSSRVAKIARLIGKELALSDDEENTLYLAALLHDSGRISSLTQANEGDEFMDHSTAGNLIFLDYEDLKEISEVILGHHERYDGKGFPQGFSHNDIPFLARIISLADIYDALCVLGIKEERLSHEQAVKEIKKSTGTLFDPLVVVAFEDQADEIEKILLDTLELEIKEDKT